MVSLINGFELNIDGSEFGFFLNLLIHSFDSQQEYPSGQRGWTQDPLA